MNVTLRCGCGSQAFYLVQEREPPGLVAKCFQCGAERRVENGRGRPWVNPVARESSPARDH